MKIHKGFLTHDNTNTGEGKILDLGFNGDFDHKNHSWNMVFVAPAPIAESNFPFTVVVKSGDTVGEMTTIATATVEYGGQPTGFPMPKGVKRYFTLAITSAPGGTLGAITAGITDEVDTDVLPGVNWTYYNADTSTSEVKGIMSEAMEKLFPEANT